MKAIYLLTVLLIGAVFAPFQASFAAADCQAFPKLEFWGDMTHTSVQKYVDGRFLGDWGAYIIKLEKIEKGLLNIHKRGKGAAIKLKDRRVNLRGEKLGTYIQLSGKRLNIVRCLADKAEMDKLQNIASADSGDAQGKFADYPDPVVKDDGYRTYVTLPQDLVIELREQAKRRSIIETRKVSVNDIITRSLQQRYAK